MKSNERKFEKSIIDWAGVWGIFLKRWYIFIIALLFAGILILVQKTEKSDVEYTTMSVVYIDYDYSCGQLPSLDNILILLDSDSVYVKLEELLIQHGVNSSAELDKIYSFERVKKSNFFKFSIRTNEMNKTETISNAILQMLMDEVEKLNGFSEVKLYSQNKTEKQREVVAPAYILVFTMMVYIVGIVLISMFDKVIWSEYDLKLFFGKKYIGKVAKDMLIDPNVQKRMEILRQNIQDEKLVVFTNGEDQYKNFLFNMFAGSGVSIQLLSTLNDCDDVKLKDKKLIMVVVEGKSTCDEVNQILLDCELYQMELVGCILYKPRSWKRVRDSKCFEEESI